MAEFDSVDRPKHYNVHPSGVECIQVTEHMNFCRGNAMKYLWRAGDKGNELEDLRKAQWYLAREIERLEKARADAEAAAARRSNRLRFLRVRKLRRWPRGHA